MTFDEIKLLAYNGCGDDDITEYHDICTYWSLYYLFSLYRCGAIEKDKASAVCVKLKKRHHDLQNKHNFEAMQYKRLAELFKRTEQSDSAYRKSNTHTPEADALSEAVYGVIVGRNE